MFEKKISDEEKKKMEKEAKKAARLESKKGRSGVSIGEKLLTFFKVVVLPAAFAGIVVCTLYITMQNKIEAENFKGKVVIIKEDVAANTVIKAEEVNEYFEVISVELAAIPSSALKSFAELPEGDFYIENSMAKNQMVMSDDVTCKDLVMDKYKSGYEVTSLSSESFDGSVNGALRRGDIVDIYALDPATEFLTLMAEDIYISDVYDSAGNRITDNTQVATSITVWVTPKEVENINKAIVYGGVQMYLKVE